MAELGMGMERSCCVSAPDVLGAQMDTCRRTSWNGEAEGVQRCCGFGIVARHTPSFQAGPAAAGATISCRVCCSLPGPFLAAPQDSHSPKAPC